MYKRKYEAGNWASNTGGVLIAGKSQKSLLKYRHVQMALFLKVNCIGK